ncbi:methylated-DNA-[protein]-cysteine S-methyltransferase [Nocardioides scoriae]|uniref:Methylated-DNA--protein-cysteine methyltransferase n=1 Tax=Nocardioides scoriae TaxID=642780 RepID=A0A1H1YD96_9ACTN|nr:methylated-DNA--[protein]-cysteine S-methyltransferase [Nocardioides scoriae]SDT18966.1 methylated-DNA-[protein]-cysteine S-methyltransferase [Nocardioides scoriae]
MSTTTSPTTPATSGAATSWTEVGSPIGPLRLVARGGALVAIEFSPYPPADVGPAIGERDDEEPVLVATREQLAAYFAGEREDFDLPLAPVGTAFQQRVWTELRGIGYGRTASYGEVARRLGMTAAASRAVGLANGRNPIPVVVPCHRVIGANGTLTGYAGGLERKQQLLSLEQRGLF